jgi:predicted Zn-dependent peptidase
MNKIITLANGLTLIASPVEGAKTTAVLVLFGTGSKHENRATSGLSHFLEHMFFKGTTNRPSALALSSELDRLGAEYNAFTSKEFTGYWIKSGSANTEKSLEIVSDMLLNPLFVAEEIEREKGVIIEELNMYQDNPMWYIEDLFENLLYGDTPAGWDTIGTKETIRGFGRADFTEYYHKQYGADTSFLVVAGKIPENLDELTNKYFSTFQTSAYETKVPTTETQSGVQTKFFLKTTDQAHLSLGVRTYPYANDNTFILQILSLILGGSMSSRLFINLRERNGLAYYVRANSEYYTDTGYLTARAGVPVDKLAEAIKIIIDEYRKLKTELVSEDELSKVKSMLTGKLPLSLEGADEVAQWYGRQFVLFFQQTTGEKKIMSPEEFIEAINKVTAEDVKRVANEIFTNDRLNLAVISPQQDEVAIKQLLTL